MSEEDLSCDDNQSLISDHESNDFDLIENETDEEEISNAISVDQISESIRSPSKDANDGEPAERIWSSRAVAKLLMRINAVLPVDDNLDSFVQQEMLDWDRVAFDSFSPADCKGKWMQESKDLRRLRVLNELVEEAAASRGLKLDKADSAMADSATTTTMIEIEDSSASTSAASSSGPPAKPQTALQLFVNSVRDKLEKQSKSRRITANAYGHIVKSWKKHPEKERMVFIRRAMELWEEYEIEAVEYRKTNPRYKNFLCTVTKEERALLDKINGKPAKPAGSAYVLYLQDTLPGLKQHPPRDRMAIVSQMWNELTEESRERYRVKFNDSQRQYREAWAKYERNDPRGTLKKARKLDYAPSTAESSTSASEPSDVFSFFSKMVAPILRCSNAEELPLRLFYIWNDLTPEEQLVYETRARADKSAEKTGLVEAEKKRRERQLRQLMLGAPEKPPATAYHLFLRESYPKLTDLPQRERTKLLAKHWNNFPAEAKKPFALRTAEMQKEYEKKIAAFIDALPGEVRETARKRAAGRRRQSPGKAKRARTNPPSIQTANDVAASQSVASGENASIPQPSQLGQEVIFSVEDEEEVTLDYDLDEEDEEEEEEDEEEEEEEGVGQQGVNPLKISIGGLFGKNNFILGNGCSSETETDSGDE